MCNEVWGGNHAVIRTVQLASVTAWMASVPLDEGEGGGDLYYMSVCNHGLISRIALADVSGHGRVVSAMTETLQKLMHENIDVWDQSDFMRGLNETFALSVQNNTPLLSSSALIASRAGWHSATPDTYRRFGIMLATKNGDGLRKMIFSRPTKLRVYPLD